MSFYGRARDPKGRVLSLLDGPKGVCAATLLKVRP